MDSSSAGPTVSDPGIDLEWLKTKIDYRLYQDCVHCGLCTASCPTYLETGDENDSPRGRIYLMRAVTDGRATLSSPVRRHLDLCLDCRACESSCPSGVQYGKLIEPFHVAMHKTAPSGHGPSWLGRLLLFQLFPRADRLRFALGPARWAQRLGLIKFAERAGLMRLLPETLRRMAGMLPERLQAPGPQLPEVVLAIGPKRATVAFLTGCVADAMYPQTNAATVRVLAKNGCEVHVPRSQGCCGAIHYHSGKEAPALALAKANMEAMPPDRFDAVVVNAAGCGAMMKDYAHLLKDDPGSVDLARRFVAKVKDVSEFLMELGPVPPTRRVERKVAYHDACHLCHGQQVRSQPRALLAMVPGLDLVPLEESEICCGAAGTYNLTQPEMSDTLGKRKVGHVKATGATCVATANVGCVMQIDRHARQAGLALEVVHPIDLLDEAYGP